MSAFGRSNRRRCGSCGTPAGPEGSSGFSTQPRRTCTTGSLPSGWSPISVRVPIGCLGELLLQLAGVKDDLVALSLGSGDVRPIVNTSYNEAAGSISPRGDLLAYESNRDGEIKVWVTTYPEPTRHIPLTRGLSRYPRWSRDGTELYFFRRTDARFVAARIEADPEPRIVNTESLFDGSGIDSTRGYDITPEGTFIVVCFPRIHRAADQRNASTSSSISTSCSSDSIAPNPDGTFRNRDCHAMPPLVVAMIWSPSFLLAAS